MNGKHFDVFGMPMVYLGVYLIRDPMSLTWNDLRLGTFCRFMAMHVNVQECALDSRNADLYVF